MGHIVMGGGFVITIFFIFFVLLVDYAKLEVAKITDTASSQIVMVLLEGILVRLIVLVLIVVLIVVCKTRS